VNRSKESSRWSRLQIAVAFGALCVIWGLAFVVMHVGLRYAPPITFTALRAFLGGIALAAYLLATGRSFPVDRPTQITAIVMGATNVAGFWGFQSLALLRITPGETAILIYVQPLVVAFGAWLFLGEQLPFLGVSGLVGGFAGVVLVIGGQVLGHAHLSWIGYGCALAGALCWATGTVYFKGRPHGQSLLWIAALQALYGSIPLAAIAVLFEHPHVAPTFALFWTLTYAGLGAAALAYLLWFSLLRQHAASTVAAFVFLVPLVAVIGDGIFLGDRFGLNAFLGGALIVLGIWLVSRPYPNVHKNQEPKFVHITSRQ
jgi:drug/metabolite transporter (DMT)-like permease